MTDNKLIQFFLVFGFALGIYVISIPVGEFIVGKDARLGQIVVYLCILLGMILCYTAEVFWKRYS
jgi:hypothetical protein